MTIIFLMKTLIPFGEEGERNYQKSMNYQTDSDSIPQYLQLLKAFKFSKKYTIFDTLQMGHVLFHN